MPKLSGWNEVRTPSLETGTIYIQNKNGEFEKRYIEVRGDNLYMYMSKDMSSPRKTSVTPTLLTLSEIKMGSDEDALCFSLVTPTKTIKFKAQSHSEMLHWIHYFSKVNKVNKQKLLSQRNSIDQVHVNEKVYDEKDVSRLLYISTLSGNQQCADCSSQTIGWASINLGIFICLECSGIHRKLGVDVSKVRSIDLDVWDKEIIDFMETQGNEKSNSIYEALQEVALEYKPEPNAPRDKKERYIEMKYVKKKFCKTAKKHVKDRNESFSIYQSNLYQEGMLIKKKPDANTWKSYWFVLRGKTLSSFKQREHPDPIETISLMYAQMKSSSLENVNTFEIEADGVTHYFKAENSSTFFVWTDALQVALKEGNSKNLNRQMSLGPQDLCKEGWLCKEGGHIKSWKKRWCILRENKLSYYTDTDAKELKGSIALSLSTVKNVLDSEHRGKKLPDSSFCYFFEIVTPNRIYVFCSNSEVDRDEWVSMTKKSIEQHQKYKDDTVKAVAYINRSK